MNVSGFSSSGCNFKLNVSLAEAFLKTTFSNKVNVNIEMKSRHNRAERNSIVIIFLKTLGKLFKLVSCK